MKFKFAFYLMVSLLITGGIAFAQETPPPATPRPPVAPRAPADLQQAFSFFSGGSFLGVHAEDITTENMANYGLREVRGVGITEVVKDSPAEKAGLRKGDVILRFDDENVSSTRKLTRLVSEVAPDHKVRLTISRSGSDQQVAVTIGKRPGFSMPQSATIRSFPRIEGIPSGDFLFTFGNNRRIGVSTTQLTKQLAEYFGVVDGQGVLVTSVSEDGAAATAGIKAGDVITAVDGEKIQGAGDLTRALNKKREGDVTLTVIRNKSQMNLTVSPKTVEPMLRPGSAPGARRVVIPSIQVPVIPEVNIAIPRIDIGVTPEIDIEIQRAPKVRVKNAPTQPI
ncbi:MAG TPA: PDZ domain-containing protein [Pyrinomonadaceae bacterium]|nr:PDZ domain-containing protein [Pyrinomonadaceae bacterium]